MVLLNEKIIDKYNKFLAEHERCNFQQSLEWANVKKDNWKNEKRDFEQDRVR